MDGLTVGSLFSGIGGLDLAVESFFGARTVWHCEFDPEPSKVLATRWPGVPNFGDITAVDWSTAEPVDIICGGFPCQDLSLAGRRKGMRPGTRSGLWSDFRKAIAVLRPSVVVIENVGGLLNGCAESEADSTLGSCPRCADPDSGLRHAPNLRALGRVLIDLAALGFDAEWHALRASDVGAPHPRLRVFVLAYARGVRFGARWGAVPGEAAGGRSSAVAGGRADASLSLLPTPTTTDGGSNSPGDQARRSPGLRTMPSLLPTPTARDEAGSGGSNASNVTLTDAVVRTDLGRRPNPRLLPTPTTEPDTGNGHARNLGAEVKLLPTPTASEAEKGGPNQAHGRGDRTLSGVAPTLFPTPSVSNAHGNDVNGRGERLLPGVAVEVADEWGEYGPAVRRWEEITRPAPAPTLPDGKNGNHRLSAAFDEWMMGYSAGWVTDILGRGPAIRACGNGVVPQQAYAGLGILWPRVREAVAA